MTMINRASYWSIYIGLLFFGGSNSCRNSASASPCVPPDDDHAAAADDGADEVRYVLCTAVVLLERILLVGRN
jgi:hypothetical protein